MRLKIYPTLAWSFKHYRLWSIACALNVIFKKPKKGLLDGQQYSFFGTCDLTKRNITEDEVSHIILNQLKKKHADSVSIYENLRKTERWPFNKRWFIGEFSTKSWHALNL